LIDSKRCGAAYNMALDEAIAVAVRQETVSPTLRLYGWAEPSVSIGCFQRIRDIDVDYCMKKHIPVVRRPTGGRAVLHGEEITYSFSIRTTTGLFAGGLFDSYKRIGAALDLALTKIGLSPELTLRRERPRSSSPAGRQRNPSCFQSVSYGELTVHNRKIAGSAQKRWTDGLLQQGSVPFEVDTDEIMQIFRLDAVQNSGEPITGLNEILPELNRDDLKNALRFSFEETFGIEFIIASPSKDEISLAKELEAQKYLSHAWTFRR
jgi:lipoate-protein ligase A